MGDMLKGRVAIVTGAGRGFGRAIAMRYAGEGAAVTVTSRSLPELESVVEDIGRIGGRAIAKDDWLMLCYASGNRDETVFDNAGEFHADRSPNRHLAFGYGAHVCLGQHLAKMEMRILYEELLPRLKSVELAGEPRMSQAVFVNGLKSLPVRFVAA